MSEFDELCENMGIMKTVKRERYPRQIAFSEGFMESLKQEFYNHKLKLEEDSVKPVRNYSDKFNKALRFEISHLSDRADIELETMRNKLEAEMDSTNIDEINDERVPEVTVDGEKKKLTQNDAPENKEPTTQTLDKARRLILKRNVSSKIKESSGKFTGPRYGKNYDHKAYKRLEHMAGQIITAAPPEQQDRIRKDVIGALNAYTKGTSDENDILSYFQGY